MPTNSLHPETLVLHSGSYRSDPTTNSVAVPIYQTTSYQFSSTENASNLFGFKESKRFSYSFSTSLLSFLSRLCGSFASIISTSMPYQVSYFYTITTRINLLEQICVSNIIPQLPKFVKRKVVLETNQEKSVTHIDVHRYFSSEH